MSKNLTTKTTEAPLRSTPGSAAFDAHSASRDRYFLGIDGGGTKTHAVITDSSFRVIGEGFSGAANPLRVGLAEAVSHIGQAVADACAQAGAGSRHMNGELRDADDHDRNSEYEQIQKQKEERGEGADHSGASKSKGSIAAHGSEAAEEDEGRGAPVEGTPSAKIERCGDRREDDGSHQNDQRFTQII